MLKLKLYLFLGKFIKWFKEMAENELIKKIENEIRFHFHTYENKDFEITDYKHLYQNNKFLIRIEITFKKYSVDPFSFSLLMEYTKDGIIETNIKLNKDIDKRGKIIFEYFDYFEKINENLILDCFQRLY